MRSVLRILDAAFNRAREALRVLEDLARFHQNDSATAAALKEIRHRLDVLARPHAREFLQARDAARDVGRNGDRPVQGPRALVEIASANFKRAGEALRSIEETSKGRFKEMSRGAHDARYTIYELERRRLDPRARLQSARLYVLLDPAVARGSLDRAAGEALRGGADVLQLRQKPRIDLGLAKSIRAIAKDAIFIVNDRPDIALASGADGVHLGIEDMPIADARRLGLGIIGATTHALSEARRALSAGADYISVGPMYETPLKPGLPARGFEYLAAVKKLGIPFFCIGGITRKTVRPAMQRVAVCAGVIAQKDAAGSARAIRSALTRRDRARAASPRTPQSAG